MAQNYFKKHVQSFKLTVVGKPDKSIIVAGISLAFLFLMTAFVLDNSTWGDLAVNLSASMITVALTVLLVDRLRQLHLARELNEPRTEAIRRIKISNNLMVLLLSVINFRQNSEFKTAVSKGNGIFNEDAHDNEVAKLVALGSDNLKPFTNVGTRNSLKQSAGSISRELANVRQNYDYAVDNDFKTALNKMLNAAEGLKGMWVFYEIDSSTLQSFTDAGGDDFVRLQLHSYLKVYNEFLMKYKIDD